MLEDALEAFIARVVPESEVKTWRPATEDRIARLQQFAPQQLPAFYEWFLRRMGAAFPHPKVGHDRQDMRIDTVLRAYETGELGGDERYLLIGRVNDPVMPELLFYDLDACVRDDAMVVNRPVSGPPYSARFETLREKLAWSMMRRHRVSTRPQRCEGTLRSDGDTFDELKQVMLRHGFASPIETGQCCALYDREEAAFAAMRPPVEAPPDALYFSFGGPNAGVLRRVLGELSTDTSVQVQLQRWRPDLP